MNPQIAAAFVVIVVAAISMLLVAQSGGLFDTSGVDVNGVTQGVSNTANAINFAEHGATPAPNNNPGDLIPPGWTGPTFNSEGVAMFATMTEGWQRLYHQLNLIVNSQSHVYSLSDTIGSMARKWTRTQPDAWASNIVYYLNNNVGLNVTVDTPLSEILT